MLYRQQSSITRKEQETLADASSMMYFINNTGRRHTMSTKETTRNGTKEQSK